MSLELVVPVISWQLQLLIENNQNQRVNADCIEERKYIAFSVKR